MTATNPQVKVGDRVRVLEFAVTDYGPRLGAGAVEEIFIRCLQVRFDDGSIWTVTRWELAAPEYVPEVGHHVRATRVREGVVRSITRGGAVVTADGLFLGGIGDEGYTFEHLPDPEPERPSWWPPQPGDWIRSEVGVPLFFSGEAWRYSYGDAAATVYSRLDGPRPGDTLIFRGGKAVSGEQS